MSQFFDELEQRLRTSTEQLSAPGAHAARRARQRRPRRRRALVLAFAAVAGLAVPAVAAVTSLWTPDVVSQRPPVATVGGAYGCDQGGEPLPSTTTDAPVSPVLASTLGVLRRAPTVTDRLDPRMVARLGQLQVSRTAIRALGVSADGQRWYVVPARGARGDQPWPASCLRALPSTQRRRIEALQRPRPSGSEICLVSAHHDTCGTTLSELSGRGVLRATGVRGARTVVVGLVPDGVRAVTLAYGSSERTFPVRDNFYSFAVALPPDRAAAPSLVTWQLASGASRVVVQHLKHR
jgi:hypothetical protein